MDQLEALAARLRQAPSPELRRQLAEATAPLIEEVADEFADSGVPQVVLRRAGHLGLLNAISNPGLDKGGNFRTFAMNLIRGEMRARIRDRSQPVEPPAWLAALAERIDRAHHALGAELGRPPSLPDLAARLNLTEDGLREAFKARETFRYTSLSATQRPTDPQPEFHPEAVADASPTELPWSARVRLAQALQRLQRLAERLLAQVFRDTEEPHT